MRQGTTQAARTISPEQFCRRFMLLIVSAWALPPIVGAWFLLWIKLFTPTQIQDIMLSPLRLGFIVVNIAFAVWFFRRYSIVIRDFLRSPDDKGRERARLVIRRFPFAFWAVFLAFLALAPSSVMLSAQWFAGFQAQPIDWFRVHLIAVIVSILVGLPIFYIIFDLFGQVVGGIKLQKAVLTIRTKVFLVGSLIPLLIDTLLVQYFWTRTGYFTFETFGVWLTLELAAICGTLIFVRSFGQSLRPLEHFVITETNGDMQDPAKLVPASTDELGVLVSRFRELLEREWILEEQLIHAQKLEAIGRLAGGVAHDFNNDLMAILGCAELLRDRMEDDDPNGQYADAIIDATNRSAGIARSLLTFSRQRELKVEPVDLNAVVYDFAELVERLMGESIDVRTKYCDGSAVAAVDRGQIEQAMMNLCLNARDAMQDGGTLTIATHCETDENPDRLRITVSDTGKGIDTTIQRHVFEPFFTTKEDSVGTGLGLPMVYGTITAHGGSIDLDSAPGAGTTFSLELPAATETSSPTPEEEHRDQRGNETVLVADDNPNVRELLAAQLESMGYKVVLAADGDEAVDRYREHRSDIDVAILDLRMPNRNGREVREEIRKDKPELPVILISGNVGALPGIDADDPGTLLVQKPVSSTNLAAHIRQMIDS